ncbi:invasion protein IalB [Bradyrhizobium sp. USDA 4011]
MKTLVKIAAAGSLVFAGPCMAQDVFLKEKFGLWSVYCLRDGAPSNGKCTVTAGVHANDNPDLWIKVAVGFANPAGDLVMTLRTPLLTYLRNGISVGFDGKQTVKAFVDKCPNSTCESTLAIDDRLMYQIATHDKMSVEYQVSEDRGIALILDLDQILSALNSIKPGGGEAIASADPKKPSPQAAVRVLVERRKHELATSLSSGALAAWNAPLQNCPKVPATKVVLVNADLTVQNEEELLDWADKSNKCTPDAVAWIKAEGSSSPNGPALDRSRMASWTLYNYVSKTMPAGVIPEDGSQVAILPEAFDFYPSKVGRGTIVTTTSGGAVGRDTTGSSIPEKTATKNRRRD